MRDCFKVKRITGKPRAILILQKYQCRVEQGHFLKGSAEIINRDEIFTLNVNQFTYMPLCKIHGFATPGLAPLESIEVQSGKHLNENDIIRLDEYSGREI